VTLPLQQIARVFDYSTFFIVQLHRYDDAKGTASGVRIIDAGGPMKRLFNKAKIIFCNASTRAGSPDFF